MGWTFYNATGQRLQTSATVLATQAEMETGTALTSFVTPGRTQYHPGVAKAWCQIAVAGTLNSPDYGIATIGDTGTGDRDINYTTAFSSTVYSAAGITNNLAYILMHTPATADIQMIVRLIADNSASDQLSYQVWHGDQS